MERRHPEAKEPNDAARARIATDALGLAVQAVREETLVAVDGAAREFEAANRPGDAALLRKALNGGDDWPGLVELAKLHRAGASFEDDAADEPGHINAVAICKFLADVALDAAGASVLSFVSHRLPESGDPCTRPTGIMPASMADVRDVLPRTPGEDGTAYPFGDSAPLGATPAEGPGWLPGVSWENDAVRPAVPLLLFEDDNDTWKRHRGAPLPLRIYIEAMLSVSLDERDRARRYRFTPRIWRDWLWKSGHDAPALKRTWPKLRRALYLVHNARVRWAVGNNGGEWAAVRVVNLPRDSAHLDDIILLDISLPPGSERGPWINRLVLREVGLESAPAYRALLALATFWNTYGSFRLPRGPHGNRSSPGLIQPTRPAMQRDENGYILGPDGRPLRNPGGRHARSNWDFRAIRLRGPNNEPLTERNPEADRYPPFPDAQLIRLCYPEAKSASARRSQLARTKAPFAQRGPLALLEDKGIVVIERDTKIRYQLRGWRILPGPTWCKREPTQGGL